MELDIKSLDPIKFTLLKELSTTFEHLEVHLYKMEYSKIQTDLLNPLNLQFQNLLKLKTILPQHKIKLLLPIPLYKLCQ